MPEATELKAAIIGLGRMGMRHVQACRNMPDIKLVAILDHKPEWAVSVGAEIQSLVVTDVESLVGKIDIAIIAVPTCDHSSAALPLLRQGISCLVEKPISASEEEAESMLLAADQGDAILQIGHIERFNPVIDVLFKQVGPSSPIRQIKAIRHNLPQVRLYDVDVVLDLMIHDLDLVSKLIADKAGAITVVNNASEHAVRVRFLCGDSTEIIISVDREAEAPTRSLTVETNDSIFLANLSEQTLIKRSPSGDKKIPVTRNDALSGQLRAFADAARFRHDSEQLVGASGLDGLNALRLANRIRAEVRLL